MGHENGHHAQRTVAFGEMACELYPWRCRPGGIAQRENGLICHAL